MKELRLSERRPGESPPACGRGRAMAMSTASSGSTVSSDTFSMSESDLSSVLPLGMERQMWLGRGATRGQRDRVKIMFTKPEKLPTKIGAGGSAIDVQSNHFSLQQRPGWKLYQYALTFSPPIDDYKV